MAKFLRSDKFLLKFLSIFYARVVADWDLYLSGPVEMEASTMTTATAMATPTASIRWASARRQSTEQSPGMLKSAPPPSPSPIAAVDRAKRAW